MTLRRGLLTFLVAALALSVVLVARGALPGWWLGMNSLVVLVAVLLDRHQYQPRAPAGARLQPTAERFLDPVSGQLLQVWEDPESGAREYRSAREAGPPDAPSEASPN